MTHTCKTCGIEWTFVGGAKFVFSPACLECRRQQYRCREAATEEMDRLALDSTYGSGTYDFVYGDEDDAS